MEMMKQSCEQFLAELAGKAPTPGGGGTAAHRSTGWGGGNLPAALFQSPHDGEKCKLLRGNGAAVLCCCCSCGEPPFFRNLKRGWYQNMIPTSSIKSFKFLGKMSDKNI